MIGVILNARARGGGSAELRGRIERIVGDQGQVHQTESLAELGVAIDRLRVAGVSLLVPFGGDGTVSRTLEQAIEVWGADALPAFALLRGGTMNMVAEHLDARRRDPFAVLEALVGKARAGRDFRFDRRRLIRSSAGPVGFTVGVGVAVNFLQRYVDGGAGFGAAVRMFGRAAASALTGTAYARSLFSPVAMRWQQDDGPATTAAHSLRFAMTIDHLPLRFRVAPGAGEDPDHFALLYGDPGPGYLARHLWDLKTGRPSEGPDFHRDRARRLRLAFTQPTGFMVDGELHDPVSALDLALGPLVRLARV